jgi:LmbE family N-acetylglucosaminyl deacetylase
MSVLAHPDDESLGVGGTRATYPAEGVDVALVTATRGDVRFSGYPCGDERHLCRESQLAAYERLGDLPPEHHWTLWGRQSFYRALSFLNGGRVKRICSKERTDE